MIEASRRRASSRRANDALRTIGNLVDSVLTSRVTRTLGFLVFLAFAAVGTATLTLDLGNVDYWQHLSAIRTLSSNVLQPLPLYFAEPYEVHLYTPFHLFWAIALRVLGVSIWDITVLMSAVNAGIFALGARLIARHLFKEPELDFVVLLTLLVFWGQPIWWSGVYSLGHLALIVTYPSFFVLATSMCVGALWLEEGYRSVLAWSAFSLAIAVLLASHAITATFLLLFLFLKTLFFAPPTRRNVVSSAVCVLIGCALGLLWPYYSLVTLATRAGPESNFFGAGDFYNLLPERLGIELLGFLALPLAKPGAIRRFLGILVFVLLGIFAANYVFQLSHVFSRYLIYLTIALQLSVVAAVSAARGRSLGGILLPAFVLLAMWGCKHQLGIAASTTYGLAHDLAAGVAPGTHSVESRFGELGRIDELAGDDRPVMMAPLRWAYGVTALSRFQVVGVMHGAPTMPDFEGRRQDVERFYDPGTAPPARREILERRGVDFVLVPLEGGADDGMEFSSEPVLRAKGFLIYSAR